MRFFRVATALLLPALLALPVFAQQQPPSERLLITGRTAATWTLDATNVLLVEGPVTIETDRATLSAQDAVIWLAPLPGAGDLRRAEIALLGDATLTQPSLRRSAQRLLVTTEVRGNVRVTAQDRTVRDLSDSDLYRRAVALRGAPSPTLRITPDEPAAASARPAVPTAAATQPARDMPPLFFELRNFRTIRTNDDRLALVLSGGITLFQRRDEAFLEFQAENAVLFTTLKYPLKQSALEEIGEIRDAVTALYLEGDVRINYTPETEPRAPERDPREAQRLEAERVFYDLQIDRAILTDAILHATEVLHDPERLLPLVVRAETIKQLALTPERAEYVADDVTLSTSTFATPSYALAADRIYVRRTDAGPRVGHRTSFLARDPTVEVFGLPVFWLPAIGGSVTDRGTALRGFQVSQSRSFGLGVQTEWGLFETLGRVPPEDLDATYSLDYYTDRGPAAGLDAAYSGGFVTETTREPWTFEGTFDSYLVHDDGEDDLGRRRLDVEHDGDLRGRALWQHQHFFPSDWQLQLRAGYVSDPTFLEEWFEDDFNDGLPHDLSAYLKRQRDSEAFTLLLNIDPNEFPTTADLLQELFSVERMPEVGYFRVGDSLGDRATLFSFNTVSRLRFQESDASPAEQGFRPGFGPGIASLGVIPPVIDPDLPSGWNERADFRQELGLPFSLGQFKAVPYVVGRYTGYTDSPDGNGEDRVFAGTGVRVSTAFWKVDDSVRSRLFDLHRIRHVVEPELHAFTSTSTVQRDELFVYDPEIDAINDVAAIHLGVRQRWQTQRGGPGRWRSADFFTLTLGANFFDDEEEEQNPPQEFRGIYFHSLPEASVARDSFVADALWRVSDTTAVVGDANFNLEEDELATAGLGLAVQRDEQLSYFLGTRHIEVLDADIVTFALNYQFTAKYALGLFQSYDFGDDERARSSATLTRRFDRFFVSLRAYHDQIDDESGVSFNIYPEGFTRAGLGNLFE